MAEYSRANVNAIIRQLLDNGEEGDRIHPVLQKAIQMSLDRYFATVINTAFNEVTQLTTLAGTALQKLLVQVLAEQTSEHAKKL